jgi:8-oxo-dGTP diphosphatase
MVVVAAALVRDGRVLVAQRARPERLAGLWELPGGRVEAGESDETAVARELDEELGVRVRALVRLGADILIDAGVIHVWLTELLPGSPEPVALEHTGLRWLGPDELDDVPWVEADRAVLPALRSHL